MNSDGNLYLLEHPVARLIIDGSGRIVRADPAIHRTLSGFSDLQAAPARRLADPEQADAVRLGRRTLPVAASEFREGPARFRIDTRRRGSAAVSCAAE